MIEVNLMAMITLNQIIYEKYIKTNPNLNNIEYDNDYLYLNGSDFKKVIFSSPNDLSNLPTNCFDITSPKNFLDIVELIVKTESEYHSFKARDKELENKNAQEIFTLYFMPIRNILNKQEINKQDIIMIKNFFEEYNKLIYFNGYLSEKAIFKLNEMSSILNWTLNPENNIPTNYAQQLFRQYITNLNNNEYSVFNQIESSDLGNKSQTKGLALTRTNPKYPNYSNEEDSIFSNKSGILSFVALLYTVINLLIMLVFLAIK